MSIQNLLQACNDKKEKRVRELVKSSAIRDQLNELVEDKDIENPGDYIADRTTPLHVACQVASGAITQALLEAGARTDIFDSSGYCAVHHACWSGLDALAKVQALVENDKENIARRDQKQYSPLSIAAASGNNDVIVYLLQSGASINDVDRGGSTPLHGAAYNNRTDVMTTLLHHNININKQNIDGYTALHEAAHQAKLTAAKLLLSYPQCDLNLQDKAGMTALDICQSQPNKMVPDAQYDELAQYISYRMAADTIAKAIRSNFHYLVKTAISANHVDFLYTQKVFTKEESDELNSIDEPKHQMRRLLVLLLKREGTDWAPIFLSALKTVPNYSASVEEIGKSLQTPDMLRQNTMM